MERKLGDILRGLADDMDRPREKDNVSALVTIIQQQQEALLEMVKMSYKMVEQQSDRTLAFYARDAREIDAKFRRRTEAAEGPSRTATSQPPDPAAYSGPAETIMQGPPPPPEGAEQLLGATDGIIRGSGVTLPFNPTGNDR
jgi:hypothetical protein